MVALLSESPCTTAASGGSEAAKLAVVSGDGSRAEDRTHEATLDRFKPGEVVEVVCVTGQDAVARRLVDLGFWPGSLVTVVRRAPLGDPTVYRLCGYRLALRRGEALRVVVRATRP